MTARRTLPDQTGDVVLENAGLRVVIAPDHGGEIRFVGRPDGPNALFREEWPTPVPACASGSYGTSEQDWLSQWRGGWQELFPNAGAACSVLGAELGFHGEASNSPWEVLSQGATELVLRARTRLPLTVTRTMRLGPRPGVLTLEEVVENDSDLQVPALWGHHPAFEAMPGTMLDLPDCRTVVPDFDVDHNDLRPGEGRWPRAAARDGSVVDLRKVPDGPRERVVYLTDLTAAWYAVRRPDGLGIALAWNATAFPHLWLWTEIGGRDFPWYGRSRVIALEPASSWPSDGLAAAVERGQGHRMAPRGTLTAWLTLALFDCGSQPVDSVARDGTVAVGP